MREVITLGWYMGVRAIKRTGFISKLFIIFIMMLTFLNLLVVRGVLVGIPDSSLENARADDTGDVFISRLDGKQEIEKTFEITQYLDNSPFVEAYTVRYSSSAVIESDYQRSKKDSTNASRRSAGVLGIDPNKEEDVTGVSKFIIEGRMIRPGESGSVVIGNGLLSDGATANFTGEDLLQNVSVGGGVLMTINGQTREYRVVGIASSKGQVDNRAFITDTELRTLLGRSNTNASEIAVRTKEQSQDVFLAEDLKRQSFAQFANFETSLEAVGEFLNDIKTIFDFLSTFVGMIGVFISAITIFIIIFVNAVARKQEIGITRAVGVPQSIIIASYFIQSLFYAISGVVAALAVFFLLLNPYFRANPIDFPFTDVFLSTDMTAISIQVVILLVSAGLAGYLPARMIIKQDVLSLILGR